MPVGPPRGRRAILDRRAGGLPGRGAGGHPAAATRADRPQHLPPEAAPYFTETAALRYPFQLQYSPEDYLANLGTQSVTQSLGEPQRTEFLTRVRHRLDSLGLPNLTATFVGCLTIGRRRGPG